MSTAETTPTLARNDDDIAFASVTQFSRWIEQRKLTSERLTQIYLKRLEQFDPKLRCVITLTRDPRSRQAKQADAEIAAGKYRGPLHGIPWGAKDLLDTAGIPTTYGAEPFRNRVPTEDAVVVKRLHEAGAVLVAKLSLGALALNDIWFGGQTMNPWLLEEGSSGSSAGPGAATAAGLVGFAIGSETGGSIVSPCHALRNYGTAPHLRPCVTHRRDDALLVARQTRPHGPQCRRRHAGAACHLRARRRRFGQRAEPAGLRLGRERARSARGLFPRLDEGESGNRCRPRRTGVVKKVGMVPVEVSIPDWPYDSLDLILFAEGAAAFEELTLSGGIGPAKAQVPDAWPNIFRQARFLSAVDFVQADRFRRKVAEEMARVFLHVDLLLVPSLRDEMLTITNFTGHPSLTLRAGFVEVSKARSDWAPDPEHPLPTFSPPRRVPYGVTLIGRLFEEGTMGRSGWRWNALRCGGERPPGF